MRLTSICIRIGSDSLVQPYADIQTLQFIVTTHSPQVLGEIKSGRILVLYQNRQGGIECRRSRSAFGRDSNEIFA